MREFKKATSEIQDELDLNAPLKKDSTLDVKENKETTDETTEDTETKDEPVK